MTISDWNFAYTFMEPFRWFSCEYDSIDTTTDLWNQSLCRNVPTNLNNLHISYFTNDMFFFMWKSKNFSYCICYLVLMEYLIQLRSILAETSCHADKTRSWIIIIYFYVKTFFRCFHLLFYILLLRKLPWMCHHFNVVDVDFKYTKYTASINGRMFLPKLDVRITLAQYRRILPGALFGQPIWRKETIGSDSI